MAAFGFSFGDFINGINLVKEIIQALSESRGSSREYRELGIQLDCLEMALTQIESQFPDIQSNDHPVALVSTVTACRELVYEFLQGIEKYHRSLSHKAPKSVWKENLRKIQWQLSMPEELMKFRGKISFHVSAIGMLLHTIQYAATLSDRKRQTTEYASLTENLHTVGLSVQDLDSKLDLLNQDRARGDSSQGQVVQVLEGTRSIMVQQYQQLAQMYTPIPTQILFPAPVIFRDAHNRVAPFNLQFIDCWDSFLSVLENLFRDSGVNKVKRREFLLENSQSGQSITIDQSWSLSFCPGDRVDMSMIFRSMKSVDEIVGPSCKECKNRSVDTDKECESCKSVFKRILDITDDSNTLTADAVSSNNKSSAERPGSLKRGRKFLVPDGEDLGNSDSDDRPEKYRRVQVYCQPPVRRRSSSILWWKCDHPKCKGAFPTKSLLDSHASVHLSNQSQLHPVDESYQDHPKRYNGAAMSQQYVQVPGVKQSTDNIQLSTTLAQRTESYCRGREVESSALTGRQRTWSKYQQEEATSIRQPNTLATDVSNDGELRYIGADDITEINRKAEPSPPSAPEIPSDSIYPVADSRPPRPSLKPIKINYKPEESPPPYICTSSSSSSAPSDEECRTPDATNKLRNSYRIPSQEDFEDGTKIQRKRRRVKRRGKTRPSQGDAILINHLDPNRPDIARQIVESAFDSASQSEADYYEMESGWQSSTEL